MTNFQIYKAEINRLLEKTQTGGGWAVSFDSKEKDGDARCQYNIMHRWVLFSLNSKATRGFDKTEIKDCAKHEFGHFVIGRLERLDHYRWTTEDEIREECECIARIFERM